MVVYQRVIQHCFFVCLKQRDSHQNSMFTLGVAQAKNVIDTSFEDSKEKTIWDHHYHHSRALLAVKWLKKPQRFGSNMFGALLRFLQSVPHHVPQLC